MGGLLLLFAIISSAASFNSWATLAIMSIGVLLLDISLYLKLKTPANPENKKAVSYQNRQKAEGILLTIAMIGLWIAAIIKSALPVSAGLTSTSRTIINIVLILMLASLFVIFIHNDIAENSEATQKEKEAFQTIREGKARKQQARAQKQTQTSTKHKQKK